MEELWYHPPQPNINYSYLKFAVRPTEKSKIDDGSATYRGLFIVKKDGCVNSAYCLLMHRPICSDQLLVKYRSSVGQASVKRRSGVGKASVRRRSGVGQASVRRR